VKSGVPCIIQGFPFKSSWDLEYLEKNLGNQTAYVKYCKSSGTKQIIDFPVEMSQFLKQRQDSSVPLYAMDILLEGTPLEKDITFPKFFHDNMLKIVHQDASFLVLFMGGPSTFCGLHQDTCGIHSYIHLLSGTKLYYLFPPEARVEEEFGVGYHFPAAIKNDLKERIEKLNGMVLLLHETEMIFIPALWWHAATNVSNTVAWGNSVINYSNIQQVVEIFLQKPHEFMDMSLDFEQLISTMVSLANSLEHTVDMMHALDLLLQKQTAHKWEQLKINLQNELKKKLKIL